MSEWCHNRLEITGKSVFIDVMLQWINGADVPRHRHAVQQSIQLFLAGAAGILKPVRTTSYPPRQGLVRAGTGLSTAANQAFESWLALPLKDAVLDAETIRAIDRLYHQSGLGALKWENIPDPAREVMHGHINMLGHYTFTLPEDIMSGELRTLNSNINNELPS